MHLRIIHIADFPSGLEKDILTFTERVGVHLSVYVVWSGWTQTRTQRINMFARLSVCVGTALPRAYRRPSARLSAGMRGGCL